MRLLFSFFLLSLLYACGDATATSPAAATASGSGGANGADVEFGKAESPDIKITVAGAPAGEVILVGQYMDQQFQASRAMSDANGTVRFTQSEPFKGGFYFAYYPDQTAAQLLISEDQTLELTAEKSDIVGTAKVTGNRDTELLYEGLRFEQGLQPRFNQLNAKIKAATKGTPEYDALIVQRNAAIEERQAYFGQVFADNPDLFYTAFKRAGQNPEIRDGLSEADQVTMYRYDFWDGVNFGDRRLLRTPVIANKLKRFISSLTPQNADSIIKSADFLMRQVMDKPEYYQFIANNIALAYEPGKTNVMDGEAIHVHMIQNYFTRDRAFWADSMTVYGLQQRADQMAHSLVGQAGPDITVPGMDGKPKRLYDLKAPYLIVYMYNPTCEHCIEETPRLVSYAKGNENVDVYAIALDTDPEPWKKFVQQYGLTEFTNVFDPSNRSIYKTYYVDNTPELYLLGPDRKIIAKNLKPEQVDRMIQLYESRSK